MKGTGAKRFFSRFLREYRGEVPGCAGGVGAYAGEGAGGEAARHALVGARARLEDELATVVHRDDLTGAAAASLQAASLYFDRAERRRRSRHRRPRSSTVVVPTKLIFLATLNVQMS